MLPAFQQVWLYRFEYPQHFRSHDAHTQAHSIMQRICFTHNRTCYWVCIKQQSKVMLFIAKYNPMRCCAFHSRCIVVFTMVPLAPTTITDISANTISKHIQYVFQSCFADFRRIVESCCRHGIIDCCCRSITGL